MTVTYTSQVATVKGFGCFWRLLFRWKGSIYKLVWPELLAYSAIYFLFSAIYRAVLNDTQKRLFEKVSLFCQYFSDLIPLSFVLGFYVTIVVQRWWEQYMSLPWPDSLALFISTSIHGQDERSRLMRRTVMRYVNLSQTITLAMISPKVKKRFPTLDHLVEAGFMTVNEHKIFNDLEEKTTHPKYWMPLVWAGSIVARARKEGRIRDDFAVKTILDEINRIRGLCGGLLSYDWISIPLVYTQVVTLAAYSFFISTLMGRQFLDPSQNLPNHHVDFYVPIFTLLQFFFFMGWLKVAESLVNPFGEDDDDFEVNWLVDRNLQVSYLIVDEMHNEHPELIQDIYWDEVFPQELPYTIASEQFRREPPQGSTANLEVPQTEQEFLPMLEEEDEGIHESMSGIQDGDVETGSTKAINIDKKSRNNAKSSATNMAASQPLSTRSSMLSLFLNKINSSSHDNVRHALPRNASAASIRARRQRGLVRSVSRVSNTSHTTCQSPESLTRVPTIVTQDSAIFRMSDASLNTNNEDDIIYHTKSRMNSGEDEEHITIKIKRRDKDGNVMVMESSEDIYPDVANRGLQQRRPHSAYLDNQMNVDVMEDDKKPFSPVEKSSYSATPPVFLDDTDDPLEDNADATKQPKGKFLNLKGFSKFLNPQSVYSAEQSNTPPVQTRKRSADFFDSTSLNEDSPLHHSKLKQDPFSPDKTSSSRLPPIPSTPKHVGLPVNPPLSPIETDALLMHKPSSGNIFVFPEVLKTSTPDLIHSDAGSSLPANTDHQCGKDILETIVEGPQEDNLEDTCQSRYDARKNLMQECELAVIPESDYLITPTDSNDLLK